MTTARQQQAISNMVENGGNTSKAMIDAGYSENTAHTPSKLTSSKAFKEIVGELLPVNELVSALAEDIKTKKGNRKAELELAFKLHMFMTPKQEASEPQPLLGGRSNVITFVDGTA